MDLSKRYSLDFLISDKKSEKRQGFDDAKQKIIDLINQSIFYNQSSDCALVSRDEIIRKIHQL